MGLREEEREREREKAKNIHSKLVQILYIKIVNYEIKKNYLIQVFL